MAKSKRWIISWSSTIVALRLIAEREKEINLFKPNETFKISGLFSTSDNKLFKAKIQKNISYDKHFKSYLNDFISSVFSIQSVAKKPIEKPTPPFTTSTLQQEASRKLGFSVSRTMSAAQKLYEQGHITYMY